MPNRRRQSTRLRTEHDIKTWVEFNKGPQYLPTPSSEEEPVEPHVRFAPTVRDDDNSSTSSDSTELIEEPVYLDGGYGWLMCFYSFCLHFIADGLSFSFGVIFPAIQEKFGAKRTGAGVVASLFLSFPLLLAPFAGQINDSIDCRKSIILGGVICLTAAGISCVCTTLLMFAIFFGLGIGVGLAFVYNAAIVMVTYYFHEKRGIATAAAVSGTGFGTMFFPFYFNFVKARAQDFGFEDTDAALLSVCFPLGLIILIGFLTRDVTWVSDTQEYKEKWFSKKIREMRELDAESRTDIYPALAGLEPRRACSLPCVTTAQWIALHREAGSSLSLEQNKMTVDQPARSKSVGTFMARRARLELATVPEYSMITNFDMQHLEHLDLQMTNSPSTTIHRPRRRMLSKTSMSMDAINDIDSDDNLDPTKISFNLSNSTEVSTSSVDEEESDSELSNDGDSSSSELTEDLLAKKKSSVEFPTIPEAMNGDVKLEGGLQNGLLPLPASARNRMSFTQTRLPIAGGRLPLSNLGGLMMNPRIPANLIGGQGRVPSAPALTVKRKKGRRFLKMLRHIFTVKGWNQFIRNINFVLFLLSLAFLYIALDVPYVFYYDHAIDNLKLTEEHATHITVTIGLANLLSTALYGLVTDKPFFKARLFYLCGIAYACIGISMIAASFIQTYVGMLAIAAVFGCCISANYVCQSVMLTDIEQDMTKFQPAYAFTCCVEGITTLFGPALIGIIRDFTGSYEMVFYFAGSLCLLSGALNCLIQCRLNKEKELSDSGRSSPRIEIEGVPLIEDVKSNGKNGYDAKLLV